VHVGFDGVDGLLDDQLTPTAAARWNTTSLRSISSASSDSLVIESIAYENAFASLECLMFSMDRSRGSRGR